MKSSVKVKTDSVTESATNSVIDIHSNDLSVTKTDSGTDSVTSIYSKTLMFTGRTLSFIKNRPRCSFKLKTDFATESATNLTIAIPRKSLNLY